MRTTRTSKSGSCLLGILCLLLLPPSHVTFREAAWAEETASAPELVRVEGIENVYRLSTRLYSGGQPTGPSIASLKKLGVKTILSVDGSRPDVEEARRQGIRYVHLPVGYSAISREQALRIINAAQTLPGAIFVHCHHGKHRGPTAAAICGMALEGWSKDQAISWMKRAGTSPNYKGLFDTVERFSIPAKEELAKLDSPFPEVSPPNAIVETMVEIDERWDRLKRLQQGGFKSAANEPDIEPSHEALLLKEHFRELSRLVESKERGAEFLRSLDASESAATRLESALREIQKQQSADVRQEADDAFKAVGGGCVSCHKTHRD